MPRARLLKPGFYKNEELIELPFEGRLLFAGLWTLADRSGHLEDRPKRIKMELFPADMVDVDALLESLNARGFVHRYTSGSLALIHIPSFLKHQSPHKNEPASTVPACECEAAGGAPIVEEHSASTVQEPEEHSAAPVMSDARPAVTGNRYTDNGNQLAVTGSSLSESGEPSARETPIPLPKKTKVTEEWLENEREVFRDRLPADGFWSFDRVWAFRRDQPYFRTARDQQGYIHRALEDATQRWAEDRSNGNGKSGTGYAANRQSNVALAQPANGPGRVPDMVVED